MVNRYQNSYGAVVDICSSARFRIAIDGAQSTGKTTLWKQLQSRYGDSYRYIAEAARQIAPHYGVFTSADWPSLLEDRRLLDNFFEEELCHQAEAEDSFYRFIVDSSIFLIHSYRCFFGYPIEVGVLLQNRYDLILYCPPELPFESDSFRFSVGRIQVDEIYQDLVRACFRGTFVKLPCGSERLNMAIRAIDNLCSNAMPPQEGGHA